MREKPKPDDPAISLQPINTNGCEQDRTCLDFSEYEYASPVAMYTCDQFGYLCCFNKAAIELWGREPQAGVDQYNGCWKMYYPNGMLMPVQDCPMAVMLNEHRPFTENEVTIERPDHTFKNLLVFPRPIYDLQNNFAGAHNLMVDITEHKKDQEKKNILSAIVESSEDAIISKTINGIIMSWNESATRIFGYSEQEIIGAHIRILIPKGLQDEEDKIIRQIREGRAIEHFETRRLTKSGREVHVSLTISPIKNYRGQIIGASKIARDISERVERDHLIREGEEKMHILNAISKLMAEKLDTGSILTHVIEAATKITGADFGALLYNTVDEQGRAVFLTRLTGVPHKASYKAPDNAGTGMRHPAGGSQVVRIDDTRTDPGYGKEYPRYKMLPPYLSVISYLAVPLVSGTGEVMGELSFGHHEPGKFKTEHGDLVKSIALQAAVALENLRLFEEVKALSARKDEFIALASHELKTPLTTIKGYLQVLGMQETNERARSYMLKTEKQVDKLNSLVTDLFDVSKIEAGKSQLFPEVFSLNALVAETAESLSYAGNTHTILIEAREELVIEADRRKIEQVLINLLNNAIKYSPGSTQVLIQLIPGRHRLTVAVTDKGIGLSIDQQQKIFTRFYRAAGTYNIPGLGLGLYICQDIIERHHGKLTVKSRLGEGSVFSFSLPLRKL